MSHDKLTRQELSWLLAQEARSAASALRQGVTAMTQPPPGPVSEAPETPKVESTLDALEDAIGRLSDLQMGQSPAARRGRIDLAALVCELTPNARIELSPGDGTEVFGEEGELRRMLHLLFGQSHTGSATESGSPDVSVKRVGEQVKISVELGPDASPTAELERRFLSRMATRHGGRLELEGGEQSLFLPADGAMDQREVTQLRKELEQAQQLGEAYARELAQVFGESEPELDSQTGSVGMGDAFPVLLAAIAGLTNGIEGWLDGLKEALPDHPPSLRGELAPRFAVATEGVAELAKIAHCPLDGSPEAIDLATLVRDATADLDARAARRGIRIVPRTMDSAPLRIQLAPLRLLVRNLLVQALRASPRDAEVIIDVLAAPRPTVRVIDEGTSIPVGSRHALLERRIAPPSVGRPEGIELLTANAAAAYLGGQLTIGDRQGRTCIECSF